MSSIPVDNETVAVMDDAPVHVIGRAGRVLRCVLGAATFPSLEFVAPDAPAWSDEPCSSLQFDSVTGRFAVLDREVARWRGRVDVPRWSVEIETGDALIHGFGAATGAWTRNDSRFRLLTLDTLMY